MADLTNWRIHRIDITKPLRFRDEADKREVRYVGEMPNGRIVFAIQDTSGSWYRTTSRDKDGRIESGRDNGGDIINVPERRTLPDMWVNVYYDSGLASAHFTRSGRIGADRCKQPRIACVHVTGIEYTVGEGLEDGVESMLDEDEPPTWASAP